MSDKADPALAVRAVTCSDTVDVDQVNNRWPVGLLVTTATAAKITDATGTDVALVPLTVGYNPICVRRVWATGTTTATGIFALYTHH